MKSPPCERRWVVYLSICVVLSVTSPAASGGRVLILHPMHSPSHVLALRQLSLTLAERGHQVTIIRPNDRYLQAVQVSNISEYTIDIDNRDGNIPMMSYEYPAQFQLPMDLMWQKGTSFTALPLNGFYALSAYCHHLLSDSILFNKLLSQRFDVAIVDLLYNECGLAVAHYLGAPAIGYWAFTFSGGEPQYTTAFNPPSSTPLILSHLTDTMSFPQRLLNYFLAFGSEIVMKVTFMITDYHIQQSLPGLPPSRNLLANLSGLLINTHPAVDYPRQLPPTFLEVGGFHINRRNSPLPKHISQFLDSKKEYDGIILFSLGISFHAKYIPASVVASYFAAFSEFVSYKIIVVIKGAFEGQYISGGATIAGGHVVPNNVLVVQWVPQVDILAHPHTKLFITHCGMHGVMESLTYGVPMVGIPVFADQQDVLVRLVSKGLAIGLNKHSNKQQITEAMDRVLHETGYTERARQYSRMLKHTFSSPRQMAVWLVEHVILTQGAETLKLSSRHLPLWIYLGVDVICFVTFIVLLYCFIMYKILRTFSNRMVRKEKIS